MEHNFAHFSYWLHQIPPRNTSTRIPTTNQSYSATAVASYSQDWDSYHTQIHGNQQCSRTDFLLWYWQHWWWESLRNVCYVVFITLQCGDQKGFLCSSPIAIHPASHVIYHCYHHDRHNYGLDTFWGSLWSPNTTRQRNMIWLSVKDHLEYSLLVFKIHLKNLIEFSIMHVSNNYMKHTNWAKYLQKFLCSFAIIWIAQQNDTVTLLG